ncbi:MAG: TolC family protein [Gammaproteobacteria bacterium]|nr:TolC family protein [Gammaproteobacteria bacterium]
MTRPRNRRSILPGRWSSAALAVWACAYGFAQASDTRAGDAEHGMGDIELSLPQAVGRALQDNPTLVDAKLSRRVQRFDLAQAENWFVPELGFGTVSLEQTADLGGDAEFYRLAAGPGVLLRLPTGGTVDMSPSWSVLLDESGQTVSDGAGVRVRLRQPLLRSGGLTAGTAPVRLARLAEAGHMLNFEAAAMDVVTAVIYRYRAVIEAERREQIDQGALDRTRDTLAVNRALIDTGRMADTALAETQAEVARRELALIRSQDRRDDARRNLNVMLSLDAGARVRATEQATVDVRAAPPDLNAVMALAQTGHTAYRRALLNVERAELGVALADNDTLWDVSFTADVELLRTGSPGGLQGGLVRDLTRPYTVGIALSVPVGDSAAKARRRARLAARTAARQAEKALASTVREMETDVQNGVRAIRVRLREVELAQRALELAAEKLEVEQEKLRLGLSTNFRVTRFQADLVQAQVSELNARIGYLNAVAALDRAVGGTLATWNIDVEALQE